MKRFILVSGIAVALFCVSNAFSQIQAIGVGGGLVMPNGDFGDFAKSGIGGSARVHYKFEGLDKIVLTGTAGFYRFGEKEFNLFGFGSGFHFTWTLIPITSGGRYYIGAPERKVNFYVGVEAGVHIYSVSVEDDQGQSVSGIGTLESSTELSLIPMAGARVGPLDIYAEYSILGDFNYFGVKAMMVFPLGKN